MFPFTDLPCTMYVPCVCVHRRMCRMCRAQNMLRICVPHPLTHSSAVTQMCRIKCVVDYLHPPPLPLSTKSHWSVVSLDVNYATPPPSRQSHWEVSSKMYYYRFYDFFAPASTPPHPLCLPSPPLPLPVFVLRDCVWYVSCGWWCCTRCRTKTVLSAPLSGIFVVSVPLFSHDTMHTWDPNWLIF